MINSPTSHETVYWATLTPNGKFQGVSSGYPAPELQPNEFSLTKQEFYFLRNIILNRYDLWTAKTLIHRIEKKIRSVKNENPTA